MSPKALQNMGSALFVVAFILLFVGWQQYQANAASVEFMNHMVQSTPLGGSAPFGGGDPLIGKMTPGTPASTTYCVFFAVLAIVGGIVCMVNGKKAGAAV